MGFSDGHSYLGNPNSHKISMSSNSKNKRNDDSSRKGRWKASVGSEKKKLSVSEDGWQLAGAEEEITTRTRQRKKKNRTAPVIEVPTVAAAASTAAPVV